ncbi:hypothetical protein SPRG_20429 [Saprolegnia parasitica CBS 223.65]|uniref:Uncharacterized protein n=1 Tax=Saprolegnia parasitica (strain CBS 223.65) TaxID=695850 RepID=A0A067CK37_SAPPC|nr:hypothetical protein SPRG_20429 [Saprolegnia parasitica CBS 223.65]KDO26906.1 hypothetical protein SPRG_20429 [Saprolegnia parasitica CBS 223.65]|eukprot:XP_012202411.1 hypothetical protein SPRG_20429 [Saprolegnia parasitica CBS 223.65]
MNVLEEPSFRFFAWLFLYDWVVGVREVVSFQGDADHLTLITDMQSPLLQATQPWQVPSNIAQYLRAGVLYVTGVMIAIAGLAFVYIIAGRGHFEGLNMLELGRVGGIVWVGRPFLLLRSVTAMVLQNSGSLSHFATVHDPWYKTLLAANEVTWLITIVNDILLVATGPYAAHYVVLNGVLVWIVAAVVSIWAPVTATLSVNLTCEVEAVDYQVLCTAGTIAIGHLGRMALLMGLVLVAHGICYVVVRSYHLRASATGVTSLFLTSGAKYLFTQSPWMHNNVYYMDRASAALVGLLTLRLGAEMVVFDIKLWRVFLLPMPPKTSLPQALVVATPLRDDALR